MPEVDAPETVPLITVTHRVGGFGTIRLVNIPADEVEARLQAAYAERSKQALQVFKASVGPRQVLPDLGEGQKP